MSLRGKRRFTLEILYACLDSYRVLHCGSSYTLTVLTICFLLEDDIAMVLKPQQQGPGAAATPVSSSSAPAPNSSSLNHGSQPQGESDSGLQAPSAVNSRPSVGGLNTQRT